jgi:hypothetical protein
MNVDVETGLDELATAAAGSLEAHVTVWVRSAP